MSNTFLSNIISLFYSEPIYNFIFSIVLSFFLFFQFSYIIHLSQLSNSNFFYPFKITFKSVKSNKLFLLFLWLILPILGHFNLSYLFLYLVALFFFIPFIISTLVFLIKLNINKSFKIIYFLLFFLSPDFTFAKKVKKENISNNNNQKPKNENINKNSQLIIFWNNLNLAIGLFFFSITILIKNSSFKNTPILIFLSFRVLSRSIEIIIAFYKDVIDPNKENSFLCSNKRIILATKSYIEIIFNFATLNFWGAYFYSQSNKPFFKFFFEILKDDNISSTVFNLNSNIIQFSKITVTTTILLPIEYFIKSFGITTFTNASISSLFGLLQVLTSLVLVLFALAGYLNNRGDDSSKKKASKQ